MYDYVAAALSNCQQPLDARLQMSFTHNVLHVVYCFSMLRVT